MTSLAATPDVTVFVGPDEHSTVLTGLSPGTSYTLTVSAITAQGVGAAAVTHVTTTSCATAGVALGAVAARHD